MSAAPLQPISVAPLLPFEAFGGGLLPAEAPPPPKDPPLDHGTWRDLHAAQVERNLNLDLRLLWGLFQTMRYQVSDVPGREMIPAPVLTNSKPHLPGLQPLAYACKVGVVNLIVGSA